MSNSSWSVQSDIPPTNNNDDCNINNTSTLVEISIKPLQQQCANDIEILPQLPSENFKFTIWHELCNCDIRGPQLKAPRIREGPANKNELIDSNEEKADVKTGKERKDYRDFKEDWESAVKANLSYQELAHEYQKENFTRVLRRLKCVTELNIVENNLQNLSSVTLPECVWLNASRNFLGSLTNLPKLPEIRHLNVSMNNMLTLNGIKRFKGTPLVSLNMKGNPVEFTQHYRNRVFRLLPQLQVLDGISRLPDDDEIIETNDNRTCVIS